MFTLINYPVLAHNVQTDANVGVTFHIEPNHNPRAGETAIAWFALTRQGGELIPFEQCDCKLAVYNQSSPNNPLFTPQLTAISPESQYRDIPGAEVVFPQAGIYRLEISGSPKEGADFQAFSFSYTVNVSPGIAQPQQQKEVEPKTVATQPKASASPSSLLPGLAFAIAGILVIGIVFWKKKRQKNLE